MAGQVYGGSPSSTNYAVFLGLYIIIAALTGLASSFLSFLRGIVTLAIDAFAVLLTFAGGVAYAAQLGTQSCSCDKKYELCARLANNVIINGGVVKGGGDSAVGSDVPRVRRCREAQADTAFMWFAFAAFVGSAVLSFLSWRRGGVK